ncbi:MAG: hypothetical protein HY959_03815 [Ignavibacteriae bacterium]|nr:hypothetical protein [Ignavibacteriota bacterium]
MSNKKEKKESRELLKSYLKSEGLKDDDSIDRSLDEYEERGKDNLGDTGEDSSNDDPNDSCGAGD